MTPADRDRFEKCLALAAQGATTGERAAARAAATRIAAGAGLTFAEAMRAVRPVRPDPAPRPPPRRSYPWAQPKEPVEPITVEELLRQKAETEAWRKRAAARAKRRSQKEQPDQEAYAAEQRARQAERDRAWAQARDPSDGVSGRVRSDR
ncbi:hypothetical protein SAMN05216360_10957 [Methylobacterium phyllostachyos]|uniref:Uncharacterized protein n=1 Tax=Methylobacterium phyllostachyos TaxID=582672 RepID=A0A1H0C826_9HYPH|nr:hypothetical protein [Methylobacterium phyllostachyos]SDN53976.1 hypothetical protein SAMN05216360_10957 [Methylobacterium phyllostachyos]